MNYEGTPGNDIHMGSSANDTLSGLAGDDFLSAAQGDDRVLGGDGTDTLVGGAGNDFLDGGGGSWIDTLQYLGDGATAGATVNIQLGTAVDGHGGQDTLAGFDNVFGGDFDDDITGDDAANYLDGKGGNDTLRGGGGADYVNGDPGNDLVEGGAGADVLFGGIGADILRGGTGDDKLIGGNGNDTLDGGAQDFNDYADYYDVPFAVVVDLSQGLATSDGFGDVDTLVSVEGVYGSNFNDRITGDAGANFLWGVDGDDTIQGGAGNDTLEGAAGNDLALFTGSASSYTITTDAVTGYTRISGPDGVDLLNSIERLEFGAPAPAPAPPPPPPPAPEGTPQDDVLSGGDTSETISGQGGNDRIDGGGGADTLRGGAGNDTLSGGAGNDSLDGGAGLDLAIYNGARQQYALSVSGTGFAVQAMQGAEGADTLLGIERISFSDTSLALDLAGNAGIVARILGAVAGPEWVGTRGSAYAGAGLALVDGGMSYPALMQLALETRLGGNAGDHGMIVELLYTNIFNSPPDAATRAYYVGLLDNHEYSIVGLVMAAADSNYNASNIGLTGLASTGLEYL